MKLNRRTKPIKQTGYYPYFTAKNWWLHLFVFILLTANSLVTVKSIEYLSTRQNGGDGDSVVNNREGENSDREPKPLDKVKKLRNINLLDRATRYSSLLDEYLYLLLTIPVGLLTYVELIFLANKLKELEEDELFLESEDTATTKIEPEEDRALLTGDRADLEIERLKQTSDREPYMSIANMSHELRSPLNTILGFAQIIEQESSTTPAIQENVAIINRSGEHLLSIINDVVDLAKIEINKLTLERNKVDFYGWLDNIKQSFESQACNQGWEFSLVKQNDLPQYICVDERRLRQIINNLINYCLKSESPGSISLIVSSHPCENQNYKNENETPTSNDYHDICFEVQNSDFPVTVTELATLFDPMVKVRQEQKYTENSSLNLPISHKLSHLMGGDLTVEGIGTANSGIIFNLEIPVQSVAAEKLEIQPTYRRVIGLESDRTEYKILIVDDSKTNRKIMSLLLESVGFQVREAVNGKEAIDVWLDWQPHMIWMDLRMPVMNGCEATEKIKSYSRDIHIPIVAFSATTLESEKSLFKAAGCDDFVGKPFDDKIIFDKIAQHLGIRYVYEPIGSVKQNNFKLTPDALNVMPIEWLAQVEQAAVELNRDLLIQLVQQIPSEHEELKNALQKQVNNFEFDLIINLIQRSQSN